MLGSISLLFDRPLPDQLLLLLLLTLSVILLFPSSLNHFNFNICTGVIMSTTKLFGPIAFRPLSFCHRIFVATIHLSLSLRFFFRSSVLSGNQNLGILFIEPVFQIRNHIYTNEPQNWNFNRHGAGHRRCTTFKAHHSTPQYTQRSKTIQQVSSYSYYSIPFICSFVSFFFSILLLLMNL